MKKNFVLLLLSIVLVSCGTQETKTIPTTDILNNTEQKVSNTGDNNILNLEDNNTEQKVSNTGDNNILNLEDNNTEQKVSNTGNNNISNLNLEDLNTFYQKLLTNLWMSGITRYNIYDKKIFSSLNGNNKMIEHIEKEIFNLVNARLIDNKQKNILDSIIFDLKQGDIKKVNTKSTKLINEYISSRISYENKPNYIINIQDKSIPKEIVDKYIIFESKIDILNDYYSNVYGNYSFQNLKEQEEQEEKEDLYKANSDLFIELYKLNKLKSFDILKIGDNEIFITGVEKNGELQSDSLECGKYFDFGGSKKYNECLTIIKDNTGNLTLKYGDIIKADYIENLYEVIDNKYLLQAFGTGDGCGGVHQYTLFDKNLNKLNFLEHKMTGCYMGDIDSDIYEMKDSFIRISNNNYISYGIVGEGGKYKTNKNILSNLKKNEIDIRNTILSFEKPGFYFINDGKEKRITVSQINDNHKRPIIEKSEQYFFDWTGFILPKLDIKEKDDYKITGLLDKTLLYNNRDEGLDMVNKKSITKVEVLSCINNSNTYNNNWYGIKSLKLKDGYDYIYEFEYNINKKLGNICSIPYKIRVYDEKGDYIESEFNLVVR